jgi:hypothetical protein
LKNQKNNLSFNGYEKRSRHRRCAFFIAAARHTALG